MIIGVMSDDISRSFQLTHVISHEFQCTLKRKHIVFLCC